MASPGLFKGRDGMLKVAATSSGTGVVLGRSRDWSLTITGGLIDVTNRDSSGWNETFPDTKGWRYTADSVMASSTLASSLSQDDLRSAMSSGTRQYGWMYDSTAAGGHCWKGYFYMTNWDARGGFHDGVFHGVELGGDGALTESTA